MGITVTSVTRQREGSGENTTTNATNNTTTSQRSQLSANDLIQALRTQFPNLAEDFTEEQVRSVVADVIARQTLESRSATNLSSSSRSSQVNLDEIRAQQQQQNRSQSQTLLPPGASSNPPETRKTIPMADKNSVSNNQISKSQGNRLSAKRRIENYITFIKELSTEENL